MQKHQVRLVDHHKWQVALFHKGSRWHLWQRQVCQMLVVYRWCLWHLWWYSEWRVLLLFKEALALIADTSRIWCQWKSGRILGAAPCVMVAKWNEAMRNQRGLKWLQSDPIFSVSVCKTWCLYFYIHILLFICLSSDLLEIEMKLQFALAMYPFLSVNRVNQ